MSDQKNYLKIIEGIDKLPSLPTVVTKLLGVVNSPETSADDAAALIENDPALTGAVLRLANSAFYGMPRSVSSITSAVVVLGFNTIRSIVLTHAIIKAFPENELASDFNRQRFWSHSIVCAYAGKTLAKTLMPGIMLDPESAFCAGILHDIGKLIFEQYAFKEFSLACKYAKKSNVPLIWAENKILGINHAEIGSILADKWALPPDLEKALVYHHNPKSLEATTNLVNIVYFANRIAHCIGAQLWDNEVIMPEDARARGLLTLQDDDFDTCINTVRDWLGKSNEYFEMINYDK